MSAFEACSERMMFFDRLMELSCKAKDLVSKYSTSQDIFIRYLEVRLEHEIGDVIDAPFA